MIRKKWQAGWGGLLWWWWERLQVTNARQVRALPLSYALSPFFKNGYDQNRRSLDSLLVCCTGGLVLVVAGSRNEERRDGTEILQREFLVGKVSHSAISPHAFFSPALLANEGSLSLD